MTDFSKVFNIYSDETNQRAEEKDVTIPEIKKVNASVNQDFNKNFVRITLKIPQMKTGFNFRKFRREPKNGLTTVATYSTNRINFEFILNRGKPNEVKYQYASKEPFRGPIEYQQSYLKYKDEYIIWHIHKTESW